MSLSLRLTVAAVILLAFQVGTWAFANFGMPTETREPNFSLNEIPLQLGDWKGEDRPLQPHLARFLSAEDSISRMCRNSLGETVAVHCAVWAGYTRYPHSPYDCYGMSGYTFLADEMIDVPLTNEHSLPAHMLTVSRDDQIQFVLFWFEFGEHIAYSQNELRSVRYAYRGAKLWPLTIKFMLSTSEQDREKAVANLKDVAVHLHTYTRDL